MKRRDELKKNVHRWVGSAVKIKQRWINNCSIKCRIKFKKTNQEYIKREGDSTASKKKIMYGKEGIK